MSIRCQLLIGATKKKVGLIVALLLTEVVKNCIE